MALALYRCLWTKLAITKARESTTKTLRKSSNKNERLPQKSTSPGGTLRQKVTKQNHKRIERHQNAKNISIIPQRAQQTERIINLALETKPEKEE